MNTSERLRPGRQRLSRDEVRDHQRERIFNALEAVMSDKGYPATSVADLIREAGVSRQTFYELFASKEDCFLASYARRQSAVIAAILDAPVAENPVDGFGRLLKAYLAILAAKPSISRLYLIGVYAAGPQVMAKRLELQQQFVDGVAVMLDAQTPQARFTCQLLVAAVSTMVTNALLAEDPQGVLDLYEPLIAVAEKLMASQ